ncbi:hypothetical protein [Luethyella okanaganae]|uniref:Uncharacterized protein n=1 Tax=Luethyella okanaganae TaxID=69372 RepID=A0ABW1VG11_9MICO
MPWWSWILVWGGLVIVLVAMLVWFAFVLGRKSLAALAELESLGDQLDRLDANLDAVALKRRPSDVFGDREQLAFAVDRHGAERARRRQARRDAAIKRGKLLQHSAQNWTPPHA